jgi:hypothetical protein
MNKGRLLQVFDFDETLFRMPGYVGKTQVETMDLHFSHPYDFYDHPVSLSETLYNIQLIKPVYDAWAAGAAKPGTISVLITHRVESLQQGVMEILDKRGIRFDRVFFLGRMSSKAQTLDELLRENPEILKVKIYEDSIQQIGIYQDFFAQLNRKRDQAELPKYRYKTYIVDKAKVYRIKGVKLSEETRIELI